MRKVALLTVLLLLAACAKTGTDVADNDDPAIGDHEAPDNCPAISSANWTAWIDAEPPGPGQLHIRGDVVLPTPGYEPSWGVGIADRAMPPGQHMHLSFSHRTESQLKYWIRKRSPMWDPLPIPPIA